MNVDTCVEYREIYKHNCEGISNDWGIIRQIDVGVKIKFGASYYIFLHKSISHDYGVIYIKFGFICVNGFFYNRPPNSCDLIMVTLYLLLMT